MNKMPKSAVTDAKSSSAHDAVRPCPSESSSVPFIEQDFEKLKEEIESLRTENKSLRKENEAIWKDCEYASTMAEDLKEDYTALYNVVDKLEDRMANMKDLASKLLAEYFAAQREIDALLKGRIEKNAKAAEAKDGGIEVKGQKEEQSEALSIRQK